MHGAVERPLEGLSCAGRDGQGGAILFRMERTDALPRMLGRYALYEKIASGGMASVHLGRLVGPVGFARTVAIKRMHPQFAEDPEFVSMFLDEARLAARIRHPNVVPTLDVVAMQGELFLVMDFVQGESLSHLIRAAATCDESIPAAMVATIMVGVLHGLHAAHEAKNDHGEPLEVVHRDVSPHNVLVGVDGVSRVLDFGVAKAAGRLQTTREGQLKGKLAYMAPEQLRGKVSRQTDVYAASVVLWEALTGRRLFHADNEAHLFGLVLDGCHEPPSRHVPGLSPLLDAVTMRGLEVDPARRFPTAREMACALEDALPGAAASKIGEWVERAAKETLDRRSARIASIESDSSVYLPPQLSSPPPSPAPSPASSSRADTTGGTAGPSIPRPAPTGKSSRTSLDASPGRAVPTPSPGVRSSLPTIEASPVAASEDVIHTQLSSGSISSPRVVPRASVRHRTTWLAAAGGVVLLAGGIALGKGMSTATAVAPVASIAGASSPVTSAATPSEVPVIPAPSAALPPIPVLGAPSAPPPVIPRSTPPVQATITRRPSSCDPPYTINAAGHRVRKPDCH